MTAIVVEQFDRLGYRGLVRGGFMRIAPQFPFPHPEINVHPGQRILRIMGHQKCGEQCLD